MALGLVLCGTLWAAGCGSKRSKPSRADIERQFLNDVRGVVSGYQSYQEIERGASWTSFSNDFRVHVDDVTISGSREDSCDAIGVVSATWTLNGKSATGSGAGDVGLQGRGILMGSSAPHGCCWSAKAKACAWFEAVAKPKVAGAGKRAETARVDAPGTAPAMVAAVYRDPCLGYRHEDPAFCIDAPAGFEPPSENRYPEGVYPDGTGGEVSLKYPLGELKILWQPVSGFDNQEKSSIREWKSDAQKEGATVKILAEAPLPGGNGTYLRYDLAHKNQSRGSSVLKGAVYVLSCDAKARMDAPSPQDQMLAACATLIER